MLWCLREQAIAQGEDMTRISIKEPIDDSTRDE